MRIPKLIRTRIGACTNELLREELECENSGCRVISGSVLSGYHASDTIAYLGRYHNQITVLSEGGKREMFKFLWPGQHLFSASRAFISSMLPKKYFLLNTSLNGSARAMVPIGSYERVMPLDILATPLLRALIVKDTDAARHLVAWSWTRKILPYVLLLIPENMILARFYAPIYYRYCRKDNAPITSLP